MKDLLYKPAERVRAHEVYHAATREAAGAEVE
jgi:hypothetical protein